MNTSYHLIPSVILNSFQDNTPSSVVLKQVQNDDRFAIKLQSTASPRLRVKLKSFYSRGDAETRGNFLRTLREHFIARFGARSGA